jgi:hypothetical protein
MQQRAMIQQIRGGQQMLKKNLRPSLNLLVQNEPLDLVSDFKGKPCPDPLLFPVGAGGRGGASA